MKAFVGVTDSDWFRFLRARPELDEINFWQPGGNRRFRALQAGEPFLFKLRSPQNFIVGGGLFSHSYLLPVSLAWSALEEGNGAASFLQMRRAIERHRNLPVPSGEDYTIGCVILQGCIFLPEERWIPVPGGLTGSSPGKTFDAGKEPIAQIWEKIQQGVLARELSWVGEKQEEMFGDPLSYRPRLGQGTFRIEVTRVYQGRCAVSGERALPTLDAAHILSVAEGGEHRLDNGLLLRADIHRLFDRGYVTVTPDDHRFRVSRLLKDEFDNGEPYYPFDGKETWLPERAEAKPRREFLEWHADTVFRG